VNNVSLLAKIYNLNSLNINKSDAFIGYLLANYTGLISEIKLGILNRTIILPVGGIFKSNTEMDSMAIVNFNILNKTLGNINYASLVIVGLKNFSYMNNLVQFINENKLKILNLNFTQIFVQGINNQILEILNLWYIMIFIALIFLSYIITIKVIRDNSNELIMIRIIGLNRRNMIMLILIFISLISFTSSIIGISLGLVGSQIISTMFHWFLKNVYISPFISLYQLVYFVMITIISSLIGSIFPVFKYAKIKYIEL